MNKTQLKDVLISALIKLPRYALVIGGADHFSSATAENLDKVEGALAVIAGFVWSMVEDYRKAKNTPPPAALPVIVAFFLLLNTGCARFGTWQTDYSYDAETGNLIRQNTTKVKATTFFEAKSELSKFKALQTDKSQSTAVGSLGQESSSTNLTALVEKAIEVGIRTGVGVLTSGQVK